MIYNSNPLLTPPSTTHYAFTGHLRAGQEKAIGGVRVVHSTYQTGSAMEHPTGPYFAESVIFLLSMLSYCVFSVPVKSSGKRNPANKGYWYSMRLANPPPSSSLVGLYGRHASHMLLHTLASQGWNSPQPLQARTIYVVLYVLDGQPPEEFHPPVAPVEQRWCPADSDLIVRRLKVIAPEVNIAQFGLYDPETGNWTNRESPFVVEPGETFYIRTLDVQVCLGLPDPKDPTSPGFTTSTPTTPSKRSRTDSMSFEDSPPSRRSHSGGSSSSQRSAGSRSGRRSLTGGVGGRHSVTSSTASPQLPLEFNAFPFGRLHGDSGGADGPSGNAAVPSSGDIFSRVPGGRTLREGASRSGGHSIDIQPGFLSPWLTMYVCDMEYGFQEIQRLQDLDEAAGRLPRRMEYYFSEVFNTDVKSFPLVHGNLAYPPLAEDSLRGWHLSAEQKNMECHP
ncbi:uncharacterized protein EV420DRAFT_1483503 [Desarmillaria tabescens]|uniref:Uncharacterized protein n=1 Tax=Armillaria tabescens TaxID=1929756 RepID=A0AA39JSZ5_ARMTA|nr:uncharacterized protein EV420DRAFT_1483503 [Desarmillaria tabescens]KAK0448253.1 hypothetical protein EV420DRAFT_1483503 [Desarmillaria tabescens]